MDKKMAYAHWIKLAEDITEGCSELGYERRLLSGL
jgi:hypothetical protein